VVDLSLRDSIVAVLDEAAAQLRDAGVLGDRRLSRATQILARSNDPRVERVARRLVGGSGPGAGAGAGASLSPTTRTWICESMVMFHSFRYCAAGGSVDAARGWIEAIPPPLRRAKHWLELLGAMGWHPAPSLAPAAVVDALALARAAAEEASSACTLPPAPASALARERERWHTLGLAAQALESTAKYGGWSDEAIVHTLVLEEDHHACDGAAFATALAAAQADAGGGDDEAVLETAMWYFNFGDAAVGTLELDASPANDGAAAPSRSAAWTPSARSSGGARIR